MKRDTDPCAHFAEANIAKAPLPPSSAAEQKTEIQGQNFMQDFINSSVRHSTPARFLRRAFCPPTDRLAVVYTMGKVASSSYSAAISAAGVNCADIHTLNRETLLHWMKTSLESGALPPPHICRAMEYNKWARRKDQCVYITGVRDPIERNLSAYFQNLNLFKPDFQRLPKLDADKLFSEFMRNYNHNAPASWFNDEMKKEIDVDIFDYDFKPERRVLLDMESKLAILRIDATDKQKNETLTDLVETPVNVARMNVGAEKQTGEIYKLTTEAAQFSSDFLDDMYATQFCEHFWTGEERLALKNKWLGAA